MFRILLLFAVFALANSQSPPNLPRPKPQTCNVLALGGGGSMGAWEAGVISQMFNASSKWDIITGVSSGALNAAFLSSLTVKEESNLRETLKTLWSDLQNSDIYEPIYFVNGMSYYRTYPMMFQTLKRIYGKRIFKKPVLISATSLLSLERVVFNQNDLNGNLGLDFLAGATAVPFLFPPVQVAGDLLIDGGVTGNILISDGKAMCNGKENINLHIIITDVLDSGYTTIPKNIVEIVPRLIKLVTGMAEYNTNSYLANAGFNVTVYSNAQVNEIGFVNFEHGSQLFERGANPENVIITKSVHHIV